MLESYECEACIMSVEIKPGGGYGEILVVTGNQKYIDDTSAFTGHPFEDNSPYYYSLPKDINFEDFIYRSAVLHQSLHTYVHPENIGLWVEMYLLPLVSDKENIGYCLYTFNISAQASAHQMSDLAPETSAAVISTCIKLRGTEDFIKSLNEVTEDIRNICNSARCCILTIDYENSTCMPLGDAHKPGFPSILQSVEMRREFYNLLLTWEETLAGSTCLIVKNSDDMQIIKERNLAWYESLIKYHVESMVIFPLKYNGTLLGYIWCTNFDVENAVKIKEVLEISTYFIASEIANYQMVKKLEILGTIDIMTGALNRNAMNNRVSEFDQIDKENIKSLSILFADLNGLKVINDSAGHAEGDRFLKKAAAVLRQIFVDEEIYRAGGDEFMVLALNEDKEVFEEKVKRVREITNTQTKVSFAIGYCFEEGDMDIRRALRKADENMYEDKKMYYETHPEQNQRRS